MITSTYSPIFALTRGKIIESLHYGAVAVVDVYGHLIASYGDPSTLTFLRSAAKPIQVLAFLEEGGQSQYALTTREIALMCASHSGTDGHYEIAKSIAQKMGVNEGDLLCGVHLPIHKGTTDRMRLRGEQPTPFRHNCSGKHLGMLGFARLKGYPLDDYINPDHPVQQQILNNFAQMCVMPAEQIALGTDGCSAPNFAVPLYNAAWAFARLCDPRQARPPLSTLRQSACLTVTSAMTAHPDVVGGPDRFDTQLMETTRGRLICKGGAEGYQVVGILPGAISPASPALGMALKISDGDLKGHSRPAGDPLGYARPAVILEVLRQIGALSSAELDTLAAFGPGFQIKNWRGLIVGKAYPCFELNFERQIAWLETNRHKPAKGVK